MTSNEKWWQDPGQVARKFRDLGYKIHGERLALLRPPPEEITKGGIIVPDNAKKKQVFGTIVAKGPEVTFDVQIGDEVYCGNWTPKEVGVKFFDETGEVRTVVFAMIHQLDLHVSWPSGGDYEDLHIEPMLDLDLRLDDGEMD